MVFKVISILFPITVISSIYDESPLISATGMEFSSRDELNSNSNAGFIPTPLAPSETDELTFLKISASSISISSIPIAPTPKPRYITPTLENVCSKLAVIKSEGLPASET